MRKFLLISSPTLNNKCGHWKDRVDLMEEDA